MNYSAYSIDELLSADTDELIGGFEKSNGPMKYRDSEFKERNVHNVNERKNKTAIKKARQEKNNFGE